MMWTLIFAGILWFCEAPWIVWVIMLPLVWMMLDD